MRLPPGPLWGGGTRVAQLCPVTAGAYPPRQPVMPRVESRALRVLLERWRISREVLELNPKSGAAHTNMGNVLQALGRIDEAIAE